MKEHLISFETAKLAKEKGFNIPTKTAYIGNKFFESEETPNGYDGYDPSFKENWNKKGWVTNREGGMCFGCKLDNIKYFESYTAISQTLLQKWLREVHNIDVVIVPERYKNGVNYLVQAQKFDLTSDPETNLNFCIEGSYWFNDNHEYPTYEDAMEKGLEEALKLIK